MIVLSLFYTNLDGTSQSRIKLTPGLPKNLHSLRITTLRLRTRIITIFSFDRKRESKSFSFPIFFMIPKESGQNKTMKAI